MKKTALLVIIITFFSKLLGFGREIVLAHYYGASYITDAYLISLTIPMSIFGFIGAAINVGYIPLYSKIANKKNVLDADRYTSNLINFFLLISLTIFLLCYFNAGKLVGIFAMGFDDTTYDLAVVFTRISMGGLFLSLLISVSMAYLQIKKSFIIPALIGIPFNIIIIGSILLSVEKSITILSVGSLIALAAQFIFLAFFVFREGFNYSPYLNIKDKNIKDMFFLVIPSIAGVSISQINMIVDRTLASKIIIGGVSALNYANRVVIMIQGIFVVSIISIFYPTIANYSSKGEINNFKKSIREIISVISIIVLPCSVGLLVLRYPIIDLLYGRGSFDEQAIVLTSNAMFFYSIGLIGFSLREVLARSFYALQDSKTPAKNAALGMAINIILNYILSKYLGIGGLALATSISAIFTTLLLFISLRKKIGPFGVKKIAISLLKILFSSFFMGMLAKLSYNHLISFLSQNISLLISICVGAVTYFVTILFMKIEDVDLIMLLIRDRFSKI